MGLADRYFKKQGLEDFFDLKLLITDQKIYKTTKIRTKPFKKNEPLYYKSKKQNGRTTWRLIETGALFSPTNKTIMTGCVLNKSRLRQIYKAAYYYTTSERPNPSQMSLASGLVKSNCDDSIYSRIKRATKRLDRKKPSWRNSRPKYRAIFIVRTLFKKRKIMKNDESISDQELFKIDPALPIGKQPIANN